MLTAVNTTWSLWVLTTMEDELASIIGRKVDLIERKGLRNPFRRRHVLSGRKLTALNFDRFCLCDILTAVRAVVDSTYGRTLFNAISGE